ncbi:MAG: MG2 domain-containing protein [Acidimicrobiaceae bacterium]|nr:MG2 domain-containing protein [Acidimicrobiaceae bacterium]
MSRVDGMSLDVEEIRAVTDRLPPWDYDDGSDTDDFNRPPESLPPPRTGETVDRPFPAGPGSDAPDVDPGPLAVLRVQPEGEVGIAPFVSITFNQPMVPLATVSQLDDLDVPATITPPLPGRWQWIGTRTLRFEHDPEVFDRLPMATSYVIEVPAGTTSQSGGELAETVRFEFETPTPNMAWLIPQHDSLDLQPVFVAGFDQRIEPAAALEAITFSAGGDQHPIRLATEAEIAGDEDFRSRLGYALDGTWVAFRPASPLEPDSSIRIEVGPHVPSAEGPNTSDESSVVQARTYAPLRLEDTNCSNRGCRPGSVLAAWFNNTLDADTLDAADISIAPALPGATVSVYDQTITIDGPTVGGTVYEVVIPAALGDVFGQRLGEPETIEFSINEADPYLGFPGGRLATVDPLGARQAIPVMVRQWEQLRVRLYAVEPNDYGSYLDLVSRRRRSWDRTVVDAPWPLAVDEIVDTGIDDDGLTEVPIDLSGALDGEHGHVVMVVDGAGRLAETETGHSTMAWVQDTDIGVDMITDYRDVAVWTTDLRSGHPLAGVRIELEGREATLTTDGDGLARASLGLDGHAWVVASLGADRALHPVRLEPWPQGDQTIWYTTDDRRIYRPGETLHMKGWVRNLDLSGDGDLEFLPRGELVTYTVTGPFGNDLGRGEVRLDDHGGFDLTVELAEGANLGWSSIAFERPGSPEDGPHHHYFQVQEFRRPEFEVEARLESAGPHLVDEPAVAAVDATYFSGGPLPDAEVAWTVTTRQGSYSPPDWSDFTFGVWRPWWYLGDHYEPWPEPQRKTFSGRTDSSGRHYLRMEFEGDGDHLPTTVTAEARVLDVNRQQWASAADVLVHPARLYVGIRSARTFVRAGDTLDIDAVVTDIDGNPVPGRSFEITAARIVHQYVDGQWTEVPTDPETCEAVSQQTPVECEFAAGIGGRYRISAHVVDDAGRTNRSELTRWVAGSRSGVPSRRIDLEAANLIPDAETYASGDTAEILVDSPFASATGLLTISHNRIIELRTFEIADHAAVLEVPITDDHVPELLVQVEIVSVTERTADDGTTLEGAPPRPAYASGQVLLRVPPLLRTLDVTAEPASTVVKPGAATSIAVQVDDAGGAPVEGANVLLIVVDEAVLAVSGYELIDPIDVFYRPATAYLRTARGRSTILLESPEELVRLIEEDFAVAEEAMAEAAADSVDGRSASAGLQVDVRENLDALALFDPDAATDSAGRTTVEFDLPDNLTRYRVMAVAVHGAERFGTAESAITARLPLQVRPSAPRFLNYGDEFELPIVVQNQTDSAMTVDVVVQTSNLELAGSPGRRVTVPANDRVEVRFPARADSPGTARFRAAAVSGDHADAQIVALPVYTPATSEAFATYGVVDEGAVIQSLAAPRDVIPQFGGLEINTSSTALQALTDAVLYLSEYRYASADAYASRILAVSALRDVLGAFEAQGLASPAELDATVRRDITELSALQNSDGGFGWWSRNRPSSPYQSIQAMHALIVARNEGFTVPDRVMSSGLWYLETIEDRIPAQYSQRSKDMLTAYALHVRSLGGDRDARAARVLWQRRGTDLGVDALAWIWPVVDDGAVEAGIERILNNRVVETAGAAAFVTDYGEDAFLLLHSDRRTDAIVLDALITMAPESDLIPKVVEGLLASRIRGRWNNVQENSFILLALNRYFAAFEATDPDFVARVWLGDLYAAEHQFSGRSTDRALTLVPMAELLAAGDSDLAVQKDGEGRLYYRLGLRYAPDDLRLDPLDRGFVVQRSYEAVDDPGDVRLDDEGVWHVLAGARVRVTVTMVNDSRRTNMALVDPMPAGFEALNPALAVTGEADARRGGAADSWWRWTWYEHQNLRDDRAEAFASYLWAGTHEYSYVVRATTPGTFVVPPAKAEEIYAPEVFGRSGTDTVVVQDGP